MGTMNQLGLTSYPEGYRADSRAHFARMLSLSLAYFLEGWVLRVVPLAIHCHLQPSQDYGQPSAPGSEESAVNSFRRYIDAHEPNLPFGIPPTDLEAEAEEAWGKPPNLIWGPGPDNI